MSLKDSSVLPRYVRRNIEKSLGLYRYHLETRNHTSHDELIDYLRRNNIHTISQLNSFRQPGDPKVQDFQKVFGKWSVAQQLAFGPPLSKLYVTKDYLIDCVLKYNLHTQFEYLQKHRKYPDIIPSTYYIRRLFGSFKELRSAAYQRSIEGIVWESLKLRSRYGRNPSLIEYKAAGINIELALKWFDGKDNWDEYLVSVDNLKKRKKISELAATISKTMV